ncbi:MAG: hypothetical protein EHM40_13140 [Chloroflexi bacterium]|nr:MAG: hypothetical protein EHM40_13140 [Chloroflexota bacterium]
MQHLLDISSRDHSHLCPRQILGVRLGLAGMKALDLMAPPAKKRLLTILETDGCFADGITARHSVQLVIALCGRLRQSCCNVHRHADRPCCPCGSCPGYSPACLRLRS